MVPETQTPLWLLGLKTPGRRHAGSLGLVGGWPRPMPLPAAASSLLCPARQAFASLCLLMGQNPAPWPQWPLQPSRRLASQSSLSVSCLLPSDSFSPKSKSLSTRCHIWKKPVKLIPTKMSRLKLTAAYSAFSTMHLRPSPGCGHFIRGFLRPQRWK